MAQILLLRCSPNQVVGQIKRSNVFFLKLFVFLFRKTKPKFCYEPIKELSSNAKTNTYSRVLLRAVHMSSFKYNHNPVGLVFVKTKTNLTTIWMFNTSGGKNVDDEKQNVFWQGWLFNEPLHNKQHGIHKNRKPVPKILFSTHKTALHKNVLQI